MPTTFSDQYVLCPYCGYEHGDAWEWCKGDERTRDCSGCGKEFRYYAEYEVTYIAKSIEKNPKEDQS